MFVEVCRHFDIPFIQIKSGNDEACVLIPGSDGETNSPFGSNFPRAASTGGDY
jgi:hypothetical protein